MPDFLPTYIRSFYNPAIVRPAEHACRWTLDNVLIIAYGCANCTGACCLRNNLYTNECRYSWHFCQGGDQGWVPGPYHITKRVAKPDRVGARLVLALLGALLHRSSQGGDKPGPYHITKRVAKPNRVGARLVLALVGALLHRASQGGDKPGPYHITKRVAKPN